MDENETDILVAIPDFELTDLASMYERHEKYVPHVYNLIWRGIQWKAKNKDVRITFMSPNNCWKVDGTFFVLMQFGCNSLFIFTLDNSCKHIYEALMKTKRLQGGIPILLFAVHYSIYRTVLQVIKEKECEILFDAPTVMNYLGKDVALNLDVKCPSDVYVKKLDISLVPFINSSWIENYPGSEEFVSTLIDMNGGYGLFSKSTSELISWALIGELGQIRVLHTVENFRNKGYGSLMARILSKKLAKDSHYPFCTVMLKNHASQKMFTKLGFKSLGSCNFIKCTFKK